MDCLINKQYKDYNRLSRYGSFPYYYNTIDEKYVTGTPSALSKNIKYSLYKVKDGESFDLIALKFYNNPTYYWAICNFNNIINPLVNPNPGMYLKIPLLSDLTFSNY